MTQGITVTVPARAAYVHILRSVLAGVGAQSDLSIEDIEDLRLAIDESAAHLMRLAPAGSNLRVEVAVANGALEVRASIDADGSTVAAPESEQFLTWHILGALTDEAALEQTPEGPAIRFRKQIP